MTSLLPYVENYGRVNLVNIMSCLPKFFHAKNSPAKIFPYMVLHDWRLKQRMSVNNKDIIQMLQGYNLLIYQRTVPINAFFCRITSNWLLVVFTYQSFLCVMVINSQLLSLSFLRWYLDMAWPQGDVRFITLKIWLTRKFKKLFLKHIVILISQTFEGFNLVNLYF